MFFRKNRQSLAQTWHAKSESHSSCLLNIKAVIAFYDHVAPGQASMTESNDERPALYDQLKQEQAQMSRQGGHPEG
jgi:hypothetical protein